MCLFWCQCDFENALCFILWKQTRTDNASDSTQDGSLDWFRCFEIRPFLTPSICCKMFCAHGPLGYHGNATTPPPFFFITAEAHFLILTTARSHPLIRTAHTAKQAANQRSHWHKGKHWLLQLSHLLSLLISSSLCSFSLPRMHLSSFLSILQRFLFVLKTSMLGLIYYHFNPLVVFANAIKLWHITGPAPFVLDLNSQIVRLFKERFSK